MPDLIRINYRLAGAQAGVRATAKRLPNGWALVQDEAADLYLAELMADTPEGHGLQPGGLKAGWKTRREGAGATATRLVYNTRPYLRWVIKGRDAIDQRTKPVDERWPLHFWIDRQEFYRWKVKAVAPNPFHRNAIRRARRKVARSLSIAARALIARSLGRAL